MVCLIVVVVVDMKALSLTTALRMKGELAHMEESIHYLPSARERRERGKQKSRDLRNRKIVSQITASI